MDASHAGRLKELLRLELDWPHILRLAHGYGVAPLLYWNLNEVCAEAVPASVLATLRAYYQNNTRLNLVRTGELLKLLRLFAASGVSAVPYKGPALAAAAYGRLGLRQFKDLDILFHVNDVSQAQAVLVSEGYRPEFHLNAAQSAAFLRYDCEHPFLREADSSVVEVHWRFEPWHFSFPLDFDALSQRLVEVPVHGSLVRTFSPEDLLLVLAVHGAKHCWSRFAWVCDIAQVMFTYPQLDWQRIRDQASGLGVTRMLLLGLHLASGLLGATAPDELHEQAHHDAAVRSLAGRAAARFYQGDTTEPGIPDYCLFHLWARERWQDRARYLVRRATTTTWEDWATLPLPSRLFPAYYLLRPLLLPVKALQFLRHGDQGVINRGGRLSGHWSDTTAFGVRATPGRAEEGTPR
jgi:hypothetical protein